MVTRTLFPISTLPEQYDIVWCRFPHDISLGDPAPKARPALVKNTARMPDNSGQVQLIYGTTNLKARERPHDFFITKSSEMDACGLHKATRFDLGSIAWIPWAEEWFDTLPEYTSPVIGNLTTHGIRMLQFCLMYHQK